LEMVNCAAFRPGPSCEFARGSGARSFDDQIEVIAATAYIRHAGPKPDTA